jgi:hypothetical protein
VSEGAPEVAGVEQSPQVALQTSNAPETQLGLILTRTPSRAEVQPSASIKPEVNEVILDASVQLQGTISETIQDYD